MNMLNVGRIKQENSESNEVKICKSNQVLNGESYQSKNGGQCETAKADDGSRVVYLTRQICGFLEQRRSSRSASDGGGGSGTVDIYVDIEQRCTV